jgi:hypothetical protein
VSHISVGVEGPVDEAVAHKIIEETGFSSGRTYGRQGKQNLHLRIDGFNRAALRAPWFVLVDLDRCECAPALRIGWLPNEAELMCFRVAVREIEAWLLADRERAAQFLSVSRAHIPRDPESLEDPKGALVSIARGSRSRDIREGLVPQPGSGRAVGPTYTGAVSQYAAALWRPAVASEAAPSLRRCLDRVAALAERI